jgi:ABC-2 type transport system permease protein
MRPLAAVFRMRLAALRNQARNLKKDSLAKVFVVLFGLLNVLGLGFWVSYESFKFVESFAAFGPALSAKMVSLLFFALLVLVILSTVIVAYATVFLARETEFFFQHPIPPKAVFFLKVTEAVAFSSWASFFLCLPVLTAFGVLRKAPATFYLQVAAVLSVFLLFSGLAGALLAMLLAPLVRRLAPKQLLAAGALLLAALAWVFLRSFHFWDMDGENNLLVLDRFTSQFSAMHSPFFPSHWAASAVLAAAVGNHRELLFQGSTLLANTLIFLPILAWYSMRFYGSQWVASRGLEAHAPLLGTPPAGGDRRKTARTWRNPLAALARKDILVFLRDPAQVSQSILFILLMVIYSLSLVRIPPYLTTSHLKLLVHFANLGAVCMIISSFSSRFLFPLLSLEGKAFWIVGLAPVPRSYILREKALFGLGVSLSLGLVLTVVSNAVLRSPPSLFLGAVATMILASICLTSLATGLGAAYPSFDEDNPARIAVGLGGTLNFFASALCVAAIIALQASPYILLGQDPGLWAHAAHLAGIGLTACLCFVCLRIGNASLARREF